MPQFRFEPAICSSRIHKHNLLIFREKFLDIRPKSVCADEMTMYVHWTCINVNRKDVHA